MKAVRDGLDVHISDRYRKWHYSCFIRYLPELDAFAVYGSGNTWGPIAATEFGTLARIIYMALGYKEMKLWFRLKHTAWIKKNAWQSRLGDFVPCYRRDVKFDVYSWLEDRNARLIGWAIRDVYHEIRAEYKDTLAMRYNRAVFSVFGRGAFLRGLQDVTFAKDVIKDRKLAGMVVTGHAGSDLFGWDIDRSDIERCYKNRSWRRSTVPGGVSMKVFSGCASSAHLLERPLRSLIEWVAFFHVCWAMYLTNYPHKVFNRSSVDQLWKAYRIAAGQLHLPEKTRSCKLMSQAFRYITDLPVQYWPECGSMVALAERSIEWHTKAQLLMDFERKMQFPPPPVALPDDTRVVFLDNGAELERESMEMGHCVSSYAQAAKEGQCYLFRFIDKDGRATVEVDQMGNVVQSYGPHNTTTPVTKRAARVLSHWGKGFREAA